MEEIASICRWVLGAQSASASFVLSESRARRGADLSINPEPEPSSSFGRGGQRWQREVRGQPHLAGVGDFGREWRQGRGLGLLTSNQ